MDDTTNDAVQPDEMPREAAPEVAAAPMDAAPPVDPAKIEALRAKLAQSESRPNEYVKVLMELAASVPDVDEKVRFYRDAAELYAGKFGNHAEAIKAYEALVQCDPTDEPAKVYLKEMYEKRRNWDALLALLKRDAEQLYGDQRTEAYRQIAELANDKIKKPEVCIPLWEAVLESDPSDAMALDALAGLHERSRNYEALCDMLERLVAVTPDDQARINHLNKLGQIAGDRLKDEARAAEAYRQLLVLVPDDRRAQEQLKKRYIALGRWDDLESLFAESANWDEFIRLLESNEAKEPSEEQRIRMLHKIAELWITQKGKADRAARSLEKILTIDAQNELAADRLIPIYGEAGNSKGLVGAIEVKLARVEPGAERLGLLLQGAQIYEEKLKDRAKALPLLLEAVQLAPEDPEVLASAERVAKAVGSWDGLVATLAKLASTEGSDTALALRLRLGRILSTELGKIPEALVQFRLVFDEAPDNGDAVRALTELYTSTGGFTELLEVFEKRLSLAETPGERKEILFQIAQVQEGPLKDAASAIETLEAVLAEDESDGQALAKLDDLYGATGAYDKQVATIESRVVLAENDAEVVGLKFRWAQLLAAHLKQGEEALEQYRQVLAIDVQHEGARAALEGMLEGPLAGDAAAILETVFEEQEAWPKLARVLEVRAAVSKVPADRVLLLRKLSQVTVQHLGAADAALDAQARALREDPSDQDTRLELEAIAEDTNQVLALAAIFRQIAETSTDEELQAAYWVRVAAVHERLGQVDEAAAAYYHVLEIEPGSEDALQSLDSLFRTNERYEDLVAVYKKRIALAADPVQVEGYYAEMAEVLDTKLGRPAEAVQAFQAVLSEQPTSLRALQALDRLYGQLQAWDDLADNLNAQLALADTEHETIALSLRLARLRETQMGQVTEAIEGYRQVLDRDPRQGDALAALERLGKEPEYELAIAEIVEPIYRASGDFENLIAVYEVQVRKTADASRQVGLLESIAELEEDAAARPEKAFDAMARAFAADPSREASLESLTRLATTTGRMDDLAKILEREAARVSDPELRARLYTSAARVLEDSVGDAERSIAAYRSVLGAEPTNLSAAESLERLFRSLERFAELSEILQQKAGILEDVSDQKAALYQAAELEAEVLQRPEKAIQAYEKVLSLDEEDLKSVDALVGIYLSLSRWPELLEAYSRKADLVSDPEEKKQVLYEVGAVYERELNDVGKAIDVYQRILELDPDDLDALGRLDALYQAAENWQELLGVLTHEAELTAEPDEAVGYQYRIAALYESRLGDPERAIELYREILGVQPDHPVTLEALERLKSGGPVAVQAALVLEQVYETSGDARKLVSALLVQVNAAEDAAQAVTLLERIAAIEEEALDDPGAAFETLGRAAGFDPQNDALLDSFERLALQAELVQRAVAIYATVADARAEEPAVAASIALRAARLFEESLGDSTSAIERYGLALRAEPENAHALSALDRLYEGAARWQDLRGILEREAELGVSPEETLAFKYRLGRLYQDHLGNLGGAIEVYREILTTAPDHAESLSALEALFQAGSETVLVAQVLEPLYQASAEWEKLLGVREGQLRHLRDPAEQLALLLRMAEEAEQQLMDVDRAFSILLRAVAINPNDEQLVPELERLAPVVDDGWERLASAYADVLEAEGVEPGAQGQTGIRLAQVFETELHDVAKAEETYRYVLGIVPTHAEALAHLDRIYSDAEEWALLAGILEKRAPNAAESYEKVDLYLRLGHLYEERLARGETGSGALGTDAPSQEGTLEVAEAISEPPSSSNEPSLDELLPADASDIEEVPPSEEAVEKAAVEAAPAKAAAAAAPTLIRERLLDAVRAYRVVFDKLARDNDDAIASLARVYLALADYRLLDEVYRRELEFAAGDAAEADVRARLAHLAAEHLGDRLGAIDGWKRVLDLRGEDSEALRALAYLYEAEQKWAELTDVLERHFDIAESDDDRVHVLTMRAKLFDEQLHRDDEALETYQRVLDIEYSNVTALRAIANIWGRRKDPHQLVQALQALAENGAAGLPGEELVQTFRSMAKLYEGPLTSPMDAADAWRKLLEVDAGDFEALDRLEAIYRGDEQWEDVVGIKMQRAAALSEADAKIAELLQVTELWKAVIGRYDSSVRAFEAILEVDPLHELAFKELEKLHTSAERWESLVELYLNRLEHYEEVPMRSDLLRRIARICEGKLGDANQAFEALVNAFADDYFDDETASFLEKMAAQTSRWNELLATANTWLQSEQDRRRKIQLCLRLGKWYGEDLGMSNYAQPYYQQVLQIDPQNVRVMRQMAAIERLAGHYPKVGQMLNKALEAAVSNDDRKLILTDLGDVLYRNMDQADQAIPYYRRALEVDGGHRPALDALERIYEERGQIQDLIEVLAQKAGAQERPEEIARQKVRLGTLLEERMNDQAAAAQAYRDALKAEPENMAALRGLERVLPALKLWPELVTILEKQLQIVATEAERVALLLRLAEVQEQQFLKPDLAAERLEQALQVDPMQDGAYVSLARCYRRLKNWPQVIRTLERHLDETGDRQTKLDLYVAVGTVYRDELSDLPRAIDAFQSVVDAEQSHMVALDALSKLYERQGDAHRAIEYMTNVADLTSDGAQRVDMYFRIGRAMEDKLSDRYGAKDKFEQALDLDPTHLPSLAALRTIAVDEADWENAATYLEREQAQTEAPRQRARLLVELGRIREDMLSDHEAAIRAHEQALEFDAECEDAALPVVKEYMEKGRFADAAPLAEMLVRRSRGAEKSEQSALNKLLGQVMSKLGDFEKALKAYQAANQLDLTDPETVRGIADSAFALSDWATALTNYQKVLTALGEEEVEARTEVYFRLGEIKRAQGQDRQAINNYEKALALDGEHRPTLNAMVAVHEKAGDFRQVAEYKRQILDAVFDGEERFKMLLDIGDLWSEREKNPQKALEAYEEARDLKPQDHILLHKLLQTYQSAEEWQKMVDILDSILDLEERPKVKAKLFYTQAQICRDKLEDSLRAVELFNAALDLNPELLEAFERINKILTAEKNWKQLERSYRKMLHRLAGKAKPDLEHNLWHQLGLIYRDRTGQVNEAIEAFRMAASLVSEAPLQRQILAELYETSERWDDAIREQRKLLEADPLQTDPYLALYRLALHKQSYDEAWCCAAVLSFLRKADDETERFFQDFRPTGILPVTGRLGNEHWVRALIHPHENAYISKIFEMIVPAALQAKLAMLKAQNKLHAPDQRFRQDPATSTITFAKTFGWAAQVLGIAAPPLYVRNDVAAYITAVPLEQPVTIAGQQVLSGFTPQELTFICGKHLTMYRPEHYLKVLFPTKDELSVMLFAGVLLAAPSQPMPPDMEPQIRATAQSLAQFMQPVHLEGLKQVVKKFLADGAKANVKRWVQAVEHTACRAGLVVSGDLEIARKIIGSEPQGPELTPQEKMKELLAFAVSEEYSAIRKALGVAVQPG